MSLADKLMHDRNGIDILTLSRELQENCSNEYASMTSGEWYVVTRDYIERQTMRYDIRDDEPVMWMAAESAPQNRT